MKIIISIFAILISLFLYFYESVTTQPNGILIPTTPIQIPIAQNTLKTGDFSVFTLAKYDISARVLHMKSYHDGQANIAPMDFALGWQRMSSNELIDTLEISQKMRFYFWYSKNYAENHHDIETQSANTHLIPATPEILDKLNDVKQGDLIRMKGYLVGVSSPNFNFNSSLTRDDTGAGACELMWVESVDIINK